MISLQTERLRVELAEPEELMDQTRFDHGAFIKEIVLDNRVHFCAAEPLGPNGESSGGCGLCCEFLLNEEASEPEEAYIPKLGVGIVKKEPHPRKLENSLLCTARVYAEQRANSVCFTTEPLPYGGHAARIRRTVTAEGGRLILDTVLTNTGEKTIDFQEYCHNFISLDRKALNGEYVLDLPDVRRLDTCVSSSPRGRDVFSAADGRVRHCGNAARPASFRIEQPYIKRQNMFSWRIAHEGVGAWVMGRVDFLPEYVLVWAKENVLCPELFHRAAVRPGETHSWQRSWTFDTVL